MKAKDLFEKVTADLIAAIEDGAKDWRMPWHRLGTGGLPRSVDGRAIPRVECARPRDGRRRSRMDVVDLGDVQRVAASRRARFAAASAARRSCCGSRPSVTRPTTTETTPCTARCSPERSPCSPPSRSTGADHLTHGTVRHDPKRSGSSPPRPTSPPSVPTWCTEGIRRATSRHSTASTCRTATSSTSPSHYYSTAAHEHAHWTGHADRLGRDLSGRFGDHAYGAEELVAELGAAFWCAQFGLEQATRARSRRLPRRLVGAPAEPTRGHSSPRADTRSERSTISTLLLAGHRPAARPTSSSRPRRESRRRCEGGPPPGLGGGPRPPTDRCRRGRVRGHGSEPGRALSPERNRTTLLPAE